MNTRKSRNSLSVARKLSFYGISIIIPLVFFVICEVGLRLMGFGKSVPLFIANPAHPDYLLTRPDLMQRYFPFAEKVPVVTMETDFFLAQKPARGLRIFVQGGSTAAGFPYGLGASISGSLEQRLRQSLPQHNVEVINTAMSAVNSHTLYDLADDIIEQQPDMVLIYAGHNEFLGILGAGSNYTNSSSFWLTRIQLSLKDFRVFQLFQWLDARLSSSALPIPDASNRATMMAKVAQNQSIALKSDRYQAGLYQFETNMDHLLEKYSKANIPVLVASIASNIKDQPPFKSAAIEAKYTSLVTTLSTKQNNLSEQDLLAISGTLEDSESAILHFELAKLLEQQGMLAPARTHYELAVAHDLLKFRAPADINDIIMRVARSHNAHYVDALAYLQTRSRHNMVGNELMLEHLHPNLEGYYVISEAFYNAIEQGQYFSPWQHIPIATAWTQRLILPSEEYVGFASILRLKAEYPFVETSQAVNLPKPQNSEQSLGLQHVNKQIDWLTMIESNLAQYREQGNTKMALKTLQILSDALPHNGLYAIQAAENLELMGERTLALHYYRRALLAGAIDSNVEAKISALSLP